MKPFLLLVPSLLYFFITGFGPDSDVWQKDGKISTVKEITEAASSLDKADTIVHLKGTITEQIDEETFWFHDNSGKIKVELEGVLLTAFRLDPSEVLIIAGEVDYDVLEGIEIEVEILKPASE